MKFFILKILVFFCFPSKKEKKETHPKSKTHQNTTIGYCWGVERAVQMAYEARRQWPGAKMHVTNEIIHNPSVNQVRTQRRRVARYGRKQCQP